jgi:hypothetical protein
MERSTRFLSLSGLSGVAAGSCALVGAFAAYYIIYREVDLFEVISLDKRIQLIVIGLVTAALALLLGSFFTYQNTRKSGQSFWNSESKRFLINFLIPLVSGGLLVLILLAKTYVGIIAPLTLIFYGLSLVNVSKYTVDELRSLGLIQIGLGLIGAWFIGYGLILWAIGFGIMHIAYGLYMYKKYGA